MAIFRYIGCHQPPPDGNYKVVVPINTGTQTLVHGRGVDFFAPDDEVSISSLEYHVDPWTREFDYVRIS